MRRKKTRKCQWLFALSKEKVKGADIAKNKRSRIIDSRLVGMAIFKSGDQFEGKKKNKGNEGKMRLVSKCFLN